MYFGSAGHVLNSTVVLVNGKMRQWNVGVGDRNRREHAQI
jgi:hypothetical protein